MGIEILYSMCLHTTVYVRHGRGQQNALDINKVYWVYINHINLNELFILSHISYNFIQEYRSFFAGRNWYKNYKMVGMVWDHVEINAGFIIFVQFFYLRKPSFIWLISFLTWYSNLDEHTVWKNILTPTLKGIFYPW